MIQIAALRSRLEKQPTDLRRNSRDLGDGTLIVNLLFRFILLRSSNRTMKPLSTKTFGLPVPYMSRTVASVPSPKSLGFRCVQNGSSARREEGAYLDRYVTDEQRSSRPIFNATLRAAASWLFFRVARSTVMIQIAALRSRLEKQPTDLRRNSRDLGDGTLKSS